MPEEKSGGEVASRSTIAEHRTTDAVAIALASAEQRVNQMFDRLTFADAEQRTYFERIIQDREEATKVAEAEREKAASNLRDSLSRQMHSGDARLEDHITHQVEQVRQALSSLQVLLKERDGRMDDRFSSHHEAIKKAEDALNKRLEGMNNFHAQAREAQATFATREMLDAAIRQLALLVDRNREDIANQRGNCLPTATFTSATAEWTTWRNQTDNKITEHQGRIVGRDGLDDMLKPLRDTVAAMQSWQFKIAGALIFVTVILPGVVAFAVYLLTRHALPVDNGLAK